MRVAKFVSVAAIAMLVTAGPALGFVKIKKIPTTFEGVSYKLLGTFGNTRLCPKGENSPSCKMTGEITILAGTTVMSIYCEQHGGCMFVGGRQ